MGITQQIVVIQAVGYGWSDMVYVETKIEEIVLTKVEAKLLINELKQAIKEAGTE